MTVIEVRRRLNEEEPRFWSDTELQGWLDEGAAEVARRTETLQAIGGIAVAAGMQELEPPPDLLRLHLVLWETRKGWVRMLPYRDNLAYGGAGSEPLWFSMWGFPAKMYLHPSPNLPSNVYCLYYQTGVTAPAGWDDLLVDYAEYHALRKDRDSRWNEVRALFESKLAKMVDVTRRWTDAAGQIVEPWGAEFPFIPPVLAGEGWDVSRWDEGHWV